MSQRSNGRFANKNAEADNCHSYESVEEAAKDLGLMAPEDVSPITVSAFEQIDKSQIIYIRINSRGFINYNTMSGYAGFYGRARLYYLQDNQLKKMDVDTYRNDQQQRVIYFKTVEIANWFSGNTLWYCRAGHLDLFFKKESDGQFAVRMIAGHTCFTYAGKYLIECDGAKDGLYTTVAIDPWQRWTELKKLIKPSQIKAAADAFWKYSGGLNTGRKADLTDVHYRAASLAQALGYLSKAALSKLSNIYDNNDNLDLTVYSPDSVIRNLISLGIIGKNPLNSNDSNPDNNRYPFIGITGEQITAFCRSRGRWLPPQD